LARPHLVRLAGRLKEAQEEARLDALGACLLSEAEKASRAGDCEASGRALAAIGWPLKPELSTRRLGLAGRCEVARARELERAGKCAEAMAVLAGVFRDLAPDVANERDALVSRCRDSLVGFAATTADQKAAAQLAIEGMSLLQAGRAAEASDRMEQALRLHEEPRLRLLAARTRFANFDCSEARTHASVAARTLDAAAGEARAISDWCDAFYIPPVSTLDLAGRRAMMERYRAAARQEDGGFADLVASLESYDNPRLRLFLGRNLLAAAKYGRAVELLEGAEGRMPDRETELAAFLEQARFCALDANPAVDKTALYRRYASGRDLLAADRDLDASDTLRPIDRNPFVARELARIAARAGRCDEARRYLDAASGKIRLAAGFTGEVEQECRAVTESIRFQRERRASQARTDRERSRVVVRRYVSIGLLTAGVASAGLSGLFFHRYKTARADVDLSLAAYRKAGPGTTQADFALLRANVTNAQNRARLNSGLGWGLAGAGVALTAWGAWWLADSLSWTPATAIGPDGGALGITGRF
jgi:hypothetical protein